MSKPTLLVPGNLMAGSLERQAELDTIVPIDYIIRWFHQRMGMSGVENRVLVLKSRTASGKSTVVPPRLYQEFLSGKGSGAPGLICTQPRRITAIKNVGEILLYSGKFLRIGQNAGWLTQYDKVMPQQTNCFLSATLQTLTQQLKLLSDDEICNKYQFILIDECHERSMQLDLTLAILKGFIMRNSHKSVCPFIVLMSATFDEVVFLRYFGLETGADSSNFISVSGLTAPREQRQLFIGDEYSRDLNRDIIMAVRDIVDRGANDEFGKRDILIFLPGAQNDELRKGLMRMNVELVEGGKESQICSILQVSGEAQESETFEYLALDMIPLENQRQTINNRQYVPFRRVIMSTNVAETGLTLSELKYVIDAGFNNETEFNPIVGVQYLAMKPAPQSRVTQRIGRVGRKFAGVYYLMYSDEVYNALPQNQWPDIITNDISEILLDIIIEQLKAKSRADRVVEFDLADIDLLDVPSADSLRAAIEKLYVLGFVSLAAPQWKPDLYLELPNNAQQTDSRFSITRLGAIAARMLSPALGTVEATRMILAGFTWNASIFDLATIAVWLVAGQSQIAQNKSMGINWEFIYNSAIGGKNEKTIVRLRDILNDQFIEGLLVFNSFYNAVDIAKWYGDAGINERFFIRRILMERDGLIEHLISCEIDVFRNEDRRLAGAQNAEEWIDRVKMLKHCIYDGYRHNLIMFDGNKYMTRTIEIDEPKFIAQNKKLVGENVRDVRMSVYLCTNLVTLASREAKGESFRRVKCDMISIMDDWVGVDDRFAI